MSTSRQPPDPIPIAAGRRSLRFLPAWRNAELAGQRLVHLPAVELHRGAVTLNRSRLVPFGEVEPRQHEMRRGKGGIGLHERFRPDDCFRKSRFAEEHADDSQTGFQMPGRDLQNMLIRIPRVFENGSPPGKIGRTTTATGRCRENGAALHGGRRGRTCHVLVTRSGGFWQAAVVMGLGLRGRLLSRAHALNQPDHLRRSREPECPSQMRR